MKRRNAKNAMTRGAYACEIVLLTVVFGIVFYFWGFRNCLWFDRRGSIIFYIAMTLILEGTLGYLFSKRGRKNINIWAVCLFPPELYTVLVYASSQTLRVLLLLAVWVLAFIIWLLFKTRYAMDTGESPLSKKMLPKAVRIAWLLLVAVFLIFFVPIMSKGARGIEVSLDYTIINTDVSGMTVTGQMQTLSGFGQNLWKKKTDTERQELLQLVADIETNELGISHNLFVNIRNFGESEAAGAYTAADYRILIDETAFTTLTGEELLEEVCHQAYHAYERDLVDLYMEADRNLQGLALFDSAEIYVSELQKDIQVLDDRNGADQTRLEKDAAEYAAKKAGDYMYWINFWNESNR